MTLIVVAVALIVAMYFVVMPSIAPVSQSGQQRLNVFNGALPTIPSQHYYGRKVVFTTGVHVLNLVGNFTCLGASSDNSIRVLFLNSTQLTIWNTTHVLDSVYNSGVLTAGDGNLNVMLNIGSGGTFYLVFDNTFDGNSSKIVSAIIDISYSG